MVGGDATGTYRFLTGFYGLTDMPAEFQKAIDCTLIGLKNTFAFLDDILIVSRGTKEEHLKLVYKCLKRLNDENLAITLRKCKFAQNSIEWVGFQIDGNGAVPLFNKTEALLAIERPKTFTKLRSMLGGAQHFSKHIDNLAFLCSPFRNILKKDAKFLWTEAHKKRFRPKRSNSSHCPE